MKYFSIIFVFIMGLFVYTGLAQAESNYLSTWSGIYSSSTSDNAGCRLCYSFD